MKTLSRAKKAKEQKKPTTLVPPLPAMPQTVARGPPDTRNMAGKGFEPWYPRWGRCPHTNLAMGAPFQARPNMGELILVIYP